MKVGIYGLGRFGSFWAKALSSNCEVVAYNRTAGKDIPDGVAKASLDELAGCDTIFLCVAISSFKDVFKQLAPRLKPGTLVMDTCSVKTYPATVMTECLPPGISLIATHPMFGPDSGKDGLKGLPFVFCPLRCDSARADRWRSMLSGMGLKVLEMDCERHDREAAYSQGVTHFVGRVLDELHLKPTELATVGYKRLMSIVEQTCNDPLQLFYDLQRYNPYAHSMHVELKRALETVILALDRQDAAGWRQP